LEESTSEGTIAPADVHKPERARLGGRVSVERVGRRTDVWGRKSTTPFKSYLYTVLGVPTSADVKVNDWSTKGWVCCRLWMARRAMKESFKLWVGRLHAHLHREIDYEGLERIRIKWEAYYGSSGFSLGL
jgi:hypothetical protein